MVSANWILLLGVLGAEGPASAPALAKVKAEAGPSRGAPVLNAAKLAERKDADRKDADRKDIVLLLDDGALHFRLRLSLDGVSLAESRRKYIDRLVEALDANGDGKLSRDEASRSPLLRVKQRRAASQFLKELGGAAALARGDVERTVDRLGGEAVAYRQDLSSSQNDLEVFKLLDADGSGLLETKELDAAPDLVLAKDEDGDECVSFQEFLPPPPAPDPTQLVFGMMQRQTPLATVADIVRDASEPLIGRRLLGKYDRNRDRLLDAGELKWSAERIAALDADGDRRLNADELKRLAEGEPDVDLSADLRHAEAGGGAIEIAAMNGERLDASDRADYAKVAFAGAVVTFTHRNLDPIASAVDNAMRQFNQLDADANGYLSRDETAERVRFERGLFELMDADGDEKVFADEMKAYVRARGEPAATTCRVNVYDTGHGFFMALDANADGRISVRELRQAPAALAALDRDRRPGIGQKEPVRHFHMEFVRGSYQLFGPSEQLIAQTPAFQQRRPIGPIWFQRMDRNNDGDLTWNEFLGPREIFHDLDADADLLVDPKEAEKAK